MASGTAPASDCCTVAIAAAACASSVPRAERLAYYESFAGEPVKQIRYFNPQGWDEVDDDHVLLTIRPTEVYLLRLSGPCLDYDHSQVAMSVTNTAGWIQNKFDYVSFGNGIRCRIIDMRPIDVAGMRAARPG